MAGGAFTKTGWSRLGTVLEGGEKNCRYFPVLTGDCRLLGGGPGAALRGTEAGGSLESQKNKQAISSWKSGNSNPSYCAKMHAICSGLALSSAFALSLVTKKK